MYIYYRYTWYEKARCSLWFFWQQFSHVWDYAFPMKRIEHKRGWITLLQVLLCLVGNLLPFFSTCCICPLKRGVNVQRDESEEHVSWTLLPSLEFTPKTVTLDFQKGTTEARRAEESKCFIFVQTGKKTDSDFKRCKQIVFFTNTSEKSLNLI